MIIFASVFLSIGIQWTIIEFFTNNFGPL